MPISQKQKELETLLPGELWLGTTGFQEVKTKAIALLRMSQKNNSNSTSSNNTIHTSSVKRDRDRERNTNTMKSQKEFVTVNVDDNDDISDQHLKHDTLKTSENDITSDSMEDTGSFLSSNGDFFGAIQHVFTSDTSMILDDIGKNVQKMLSQDENENENNDDYKRHEPTTQKHNSGVTEQDTIDIQSLISNNDDNSSVDSEESNAIINVIDSEKSELINESINTNNLQSELKQADRIDTTNNKMEVESQELELELDLDIKSMSIENQQKNDSDAEEQRTIKPKRKKVIDYDDDDENETPTVQIISTDFLAFVATKNKKKDENVVYDSDYGKHQKKLQTASSSPKNKKSLTQNITPILIDNESDDNDDDDSKYKKNKGNKNTVQEKEKKKRGNSSGLSKFVLNSAEESDDGNNEEEKKEGEEEEEEEEEEDEYDSCDSFVDNEEEGKKKNESSEEKEREVKHKKKKLKSLKKKLRIKRDQLNIYLDGEHSSSSENDDVEEKREDKIRKTELSIKRLEAKISELEKDDIKSHAALFNMKTMEKDVDPVQCYLNIQKQKKQRQAPDLDTLSGEEESENDIIYGAAISTRSDSDNDNIDDRNGNNNNSKHKNNDKPPKNQKSITDFLGNSSITSAISNNLKLYADDAKEEVMKKSAPINKKSEKKKLTEEEKVMIDNTNIHMRNTLSEIALVNEILLSDSGISTIQSKYKAILHYIKKTYGDNSLTSNDFCVIIKLIVSCAAKLFISKYDDKQVQHLIKNTELLDRYKDYKEEVINFKQSIQNQYKQCSNKYTKEITNALATKKGKMTDLQKRMDVMYLFPRIIPNLLFTVNIECKEITVNHPDIGKGIKEFRCALTGHKFKQNEKCYSVTLYALLSKSQNESTDTKKSNETDSNNNNNKTQDSNQVVTFTYNIMKYNDSEYPDMYVDLIKSVWNLCIIGMNFTRRISEWMKKTFQLLNSNAKQIQPELQQSYINNFLDDMDIIQELVENYVLLRLVVFKRALYVPDEPEKTQ